jgi:GNAT superfamily N-acetyltransferase
VISPDVVTDPSRSKPSFGRLTLPAPGFETFTFPRFRSLVLAEDPEPASPRLAFGTSLDGQPAGLVLLSRIYGEGECRLLSIMVSHAARRAGIGSRLLAFAEEMARQQGVRKLRAEHSTRLLSRAAYEALVRKAGWTAPSEREYRLSGKAAWAIEAARDWAPFLGRLRERGFSTTTWAEASADDRANVAALLATEVPEADRSFDPLVREGRRDALPELSLLLRRQERVVGWLLGSRGALPGVVHYAAGYVLPGFQKGGWLIAGVREVCERQVAVLGPETVAVFETSPKNAGMRRLMEGLLARYQDRYEGWMDARLECEKSLFPG